MTDTAPTHWLAQPAAADAGVLPADNLYINPGVITYRDSEPMTDTPITRAARRMAQIESGTDCFDQLDDGEQERLREVVRGVLQAVWEPSDSMIQAAQDTVTINHPADVWPAMIDAAIAEG